ncbi:MAG: Type 1 glutamine amidotransferase-like domain-containing protein [Ignavibacteriales bacterium]|nr:Type 1 glutamine amidotransferase-like domain-containing protein [Ignavibacteriales bacterium]MCF8437227.1 Type 1 glutamine amidotransferase-like domain-containing protein [Ignavibacteriales bacterium]
MRILDKMHRQTAIQINCLSRKGKTLLLSIFIFVLSIQLNAQGRILAVGGGSEDYNSWSDGAYSKVAEGSAKILILSVNDETSWLPNYFLSLGAASAKNLKINSKNLADSQSMYDTLKTANAIFIKGGDQWSYIGTWRNTKTEQAIKEIYDSGGIIAGTSAGAMTLGEYDFSAQAGSVYPGECILNPELNYIRIDTTFLNIIPGVIFDTHFIERGRWGRLIPFQLRAYQSYNNKITGIGIDDRTALYIDSDGVCEVFGSGSVSVFNFDEKTQFSIDAGQYYIDRLKCDMLVEGWKYDLNAGEVSFYPPSALDFIHSGNENYPEGDIYISSGKNIFGNELSNSLNLFSNKADMSKLLVIFPYNEPNTAIQMTDSLLARSIFSDLLLYSEAINNDPASVQLIQQASALIIGGEDLTLLSGLNGSHSLGNKFRERVAAGLPTLFAGNTGKLAGEFYVGNTDSNPYAAYRGLLTINSGLNHFTDLIFQSGVFRHSDYYENRSASVPLGIVECNRDFGVFAQDGLNLFFESTTKTIENFGNSAVIYISASESRKTDKSKYIMSGANSPRQSVAADNLRYSVTNFVNSYSLLSRSFNNVNSVQPASILPDDFTVSVYPNPFNPNATLYIQTKDRSHLRISLWNILGEEQGVIFEGYCNRSLKLPINSVERNLSSGVYFIMLQNGSKVKSHKIVVLK